MKTNKLRFIVFLLMLSMVAVACGGGTAEEAEEAPATTEAPQETLAAPATTAHVPLYAWSCQGHVVARCLSQYWHPSRY